MANKKNEFNKEVLRKNGITCRKTPRTKEELANLICVYNSKKDTIEIKPKDYILTEDETFILTKGLCEKYKSSTTIEKNNEKKSNKEQGFSK